MLLALGEEVTGSPFYFARIIFNLGPVSGGPRGCGRNGSTADNPEKFMFSRYGIAVVLYVCL